MFTSKFGNYVMTNIVVATGQVFLNLSNKKYGIMTSSGNNIYPTHQYYFWSILGKP